MPTECSPDRFAFARVDGRAVVACSMVARSPPTREHCSWAPPTGRSAWSAVRGLLSRSPRGGSGRAQLGHPGRPARVRPGAGLRGPGRPRHAAPRPGAGRVSGKLSARRADCAPLAGKSTLNRLEHAPAGEPTRYHKIGHDGAAIERLFVDLFLDAHTVPPEQIVLDLDATDDPLHGQQEGRFFHGYYGCYCYLPLYVFCGDHLLVAKLRRSNIDASAGAVEEVERMVRQIRTRWPEVRIVLRADSGFARDPLMVWCEANGVDYVLGLARNPRFVVTSLSAQAWAAQPLYEQLYCARGQAENLMYGRLPPRKRCLRRSGMVRSAAVMYPASHAATWLRALMRSAAGSRLSSRARSSVLLSGSADPGLTGHAIVSKIALAARGNCGRLLPGGQPRTGRSSRASSCPFDATTDHAGAR